MTHPRDDLAMAPFTRLQQRIVDALIEAYPRRLHMNTLIDAAYFDDPNGGPLTAHATVKGYLHHIRKILLRYNWEIPRPEAGFEPRGYYRLAPVANDNRIDAERKVA